MPAPRRVAVAASAGRDSAALLHCTVRAALPLGIEVWALHVHHALMPQADGWLSQVRAQARRWGANFDSRRLAGSPGRGESVEAWARAGRYAALAEMARSAGCGLVLLAHHRRDQAETWLLQALRGAGPAGLAAMPAKKSRGDIDWARPWLTLPREAIEAYVRRHRLRFADDPGNAAGDLARARLRRVVWPALESAFADAETTLAAAAAQAQHAARLAREVAELDLPAVTAEGGLRLEGWRGLPPARRRNVLRAWLMQVLSAPPPESLLQRLQAELPGRASGQWPAPAGSLHLSRGRLLHVPEAPSVSEDAVREAAARTCDLSRPGDWDMPHWGGRLEVRRCDRDGIAAEHLRAALARPRQGGERFALRPGGVARSLKKQFQALGIPAWERHGPIIVTGAGQLAFVPGLGIDARLRAPEGTPQLSLRWRAAATTGRRQPDR